MGLIAASLATLLHAGDALVVMVFAISAYPLPHKANTPETVRLF
jgi:hypothetical protein